MPEVLFLLVPRKAHAGEWWNSTFRSWELGYILSLRSGTETPSVGSGTSFHCTNKIPPGCVGKAKTLFPVQNSMSRLSCNCTDERFLAPNHCVLLLHALIQTCWEHLDFTPCFNYQSQAHQILDVRQFCMFTLCPHNFWRKTFEETSLLHDHISHNWDLVLLIPEQLEGHSFPPGTPTPFRQMLLSVWDYQCLTSYWIYHVNDSWKLQAAHYGECILLTKVVLETRTSN